MALVHKLAKIIYIFFLIITLISDLLGISGNGLYTRHLFIKRGEFNLSCYLGNTIVSQTNVLFWLSQRGISLEGFLWRVLLKHINNIIKE